MGKRGKRCGLQYQLRKLYSDYEQVYHRPLTEWSYWEENLVPYQTKIPGIDIKVVEDVTETSGHFIFPTPVKSEFPKVPEPSSRKKLSKERFDKQTPVSSIPKLFSLTLFLLSS